MLAVTATRLDDTQIDVLGITCNSIDYASIVTAQRNNDESFDGCQLRPTWGVGFRPAEDIIIPVNLCSLHFAALKLGLSEGFAVEPGFFD